MATDFKGTDSGTSRKGQPIAGAPPCLPELAYLRRKSDAPVKSNPGLWVIRWLPPQPVALDSTYAEGFPVSCVATGDVNLDGRADFVVGSLGDADAWVFVNNRDGTLKSPIAAFASGATDQIVVADIDGDGKNDLLLGYLAVGGGLRYLKNTTR